MLSDQYKNLSNSDRSLLLSFCAQRWEKSQEDKGSSQVPKYTLKTFVSAQFPACKAERTIRQGSEKNHGKFGKLKVILYGYNGRNVDKTCRAQIMQRHWNSFLVRDKKLLKEFLKRNDMIRFAFF